MASRQIEDLHPDLQGKAKQFLFLCEQQIPDAEIIIVCTYRSDLEQAQLYALGRTKPGNVVTRAKPGQSAHNATLDGRPAARAFDFGVIVGGKYDAAGKHPAWEQAGQIAMNLGLNWYGRPGAPFREMPHCQLK